MKDIIDNEIEVMDWVLV